MIDWGKYNHAGDRRGTGEEEQKSDQNSIRMLNYGKYYSPASKSNFWNLMLLHTKYTYTNDNDGTNKKRPMRQNF